MMHNDSDDQKHDPIGDTNKSMPIDPMAGSQPDREMMTLIPWKDIWTSLKIASHRGNGEMVAVFYDTLFKEAIFDDNGAWAWDFTKRN